ncbi:MAG: TerC family protein [Bacteroidetes bacterium]|nr:MAG: TerC family protein [Bacteroidota bacterium]TAG88059.1 MAG: TerC family protein [Bacteroidota bacterium]
MEYLLTTEGMISLFTLTFMEVVLGIDNIVFIAIVAGKLPANEQKKARNWGLILAVLPRLLLLLIISWLVGLKGKLIDITIFQQNIYITQKGFILLIGGLFLLYKATTEIHGKIEGHLEEGQVSKKRITLLGAILQIVILNIVFSLDSVLTAVGLSKHIEVMIVAIILSLLITLAAASSVTNFVDKHPTVKMLALSFLLLIGFLLVTESFVVNGHPIEVPKGYVYFAMAFSLFVEVLNLQMRKKHEIKNQQHLDL